MSRKRHTAADEPHFLVRTMAADFADGEVVAPRAHAWGQLGNFAGNGGSR